MEEIRSYGKSDIKLNNRILVLNLIKEYHAVSRIQLAKITNMSPTSMTRIVNDLKELNLVCEVETASNRLGRKATMIAINKDAFYSLGVAIEHNQIRIALIDSTYEVLFMMEYELCFEEKSCSEIAEFVYLKYPEFIFLAEEATALSLREDLSCIGVSFPGIVDDQHKTIITSPILGEEVGEKLRNHLIHLFQLPVYVENDIKASLYNEYYRFIGKEEASIAYVYLDTGIGAALMINGEIYRGNAFGAGELAYASMNKEQQGQFFTNLTYHKLLECARKHGLATSNLAEVETACKHQEEKAIEWVDYVAGEVAKLLNIVNVFYNPSKILLGGSVIRELPELVGRVAEKKELFYQVLYGEQQITATHQPVGGEAVGAAIVALDEQLVELLKDKWY